MIYEINSDALILSDSHSQYNRMELIKVLQNLNPIPSQIILLGDILNLLIGSIKSSIKQNQDALQVLEELSKKTKILYLEGNHDFNLSPILKNAMKIQRGVQPIICRFKCKYLLLAHGDIFLSKKYEIYAKVLRSYLLTLMLKIIDFLSFGRVYNYIAKKVQNKTIKIPNKSQIDSVIQKRIIAYEKYMQKKNIKVDYVIEGHFHMKKRKKTKDFLYIAMPPYLYDKKIYTLNELMD